MTRRTVRSLMLALRAIVAAEGQHPVPSSREHASARASSTRRSLLEVVEFAQTQFITAMLTATACRPGMAMTRRNRRRSGVTSRSNAVAAARSCAELAIVDQLVHDGWGAVRVSAFAGARARRRWFPAERFRPITEAGAPAGAAQILDPAARAAAAWEDSSTYSRGASQTRSGSSKPRTPGIASRHPLPVPGYSPAVPRTPAVQGHRGPPRP